MTRRVRPPYPGVLLKIVLLAYSRGIVSSRRIEAACWENVLFIAVSGDSQPHFTTLAAFVSELGDLAAKLFAQVLTVCDRQGLIGREMFAIDRLALHLPGRQTALFEWFELHLQRLRGDEIPWR